MEAIFLHRSLAHSLRTLAGINLCSTTARKSALDARAKSQCVSHPPILNNSTETPKDPGPGCLARPTQRYHKITPQKPIWRVSTKEKTPNRGKRGLTVYPPAISPECPRYSYLPCMHNCHGDWAISLRLAYTAISSSTR